MSLRTLTDIKLSVGTSETELIKLAEKKLGRKAKHFAIKKKSFDARNKSDIKYVYTIEFSDEALPKPPVAPVTSAKPFFILTLNSISYLN